ncbi:probable ABC transporter permease protein [Burkholderiales bacterium GJ-E10]|nr:probable ABC transporter permease protein [Burkholderiales bacterium GJ-E10]
MVVEHGAAQRLLRPLRHLHERPVAQPGRGVEQFLAARRGNTLAGGEGLAGIVAVFVVFAVVGIFVLALEPGLDGGFALGELGVERLAMGGVDLGAQLLIPRGKAQGLDAFVRELAFQAQRALDSDLPVAEVCVVEPFAFGGFLLLAAA